MLNKEQSVEVSDTSKAAWQQRSWLPYSSVNLNSAKALFV
jgi:hypothetical protein